MVKYSDDYNPIIEYNEKIQSGEITACYKIKKVYQHIVDNINNPDFEYEYDVKKANAALEFIENYCRHSKGKWGGKLITLELWQKAFIAAIFGMVHKVTRLRQYKEVFHVVARKNGKSIIGATIGLKCLIADQENGAECYSVANKKDQAKIVWSEAERMVRKSKSLSARLTLLNNKIKFKAKDSSFEPLSSDSSTQDGLNVHFASFDEIHAAKDQNLFDVVVDGTSSREQPLILTITTSGIEREKVYDAKYEEAELVITGYSDPDIYYDERFLPVIYELDDKDEWKDEKNWIKANPNLGVSKTLEYLRDQVAKAKVMIERVPNLLCKDFDVPQISSEKFFTLDIITNTTKFDITELNPKYGIGGTDLSRTTDLTSASMLFEVPGDDNIYYETMYWLPEDLFGIRIKDDNMKYGLWYDRGLLRLCKGNQINPHDVTEWFEELGNDKGIYLYMHGYDKYAAAMWINEMDDVFGKVNIAVRQGKQTLSNPMRLMKADFQSKKIIYNNNPITKWNLTNVAVDVDRNDNIQPCKTSNQRKRIDGFAGMLNAYVVWNDNKTDYRSFIGKK